MLTVCCPFLALAGTTICGRSELRKTDLRSVSSKYTFTRTLLENPGHLVRVTASPGFARVGSIPSTKAFRGSGSGSGLGSGEGKGFQSHQNSTAAHPPFSYHRS